jgi:hypothetical protein
MLRETLFTLWGDLEEKKTAYLSKRNLKGGKVDKECSKLPFAVADPKASHAKPIDDLPPDSDDESILPNGRGTKSSPTTDIESNPSKMDTKDEDLSDVISSLPIINKGFTCCIKQYGIKVSEKSPSKCDAGEGLRWRKMFGLFGTTIV